MPNGRQVNPDLVCPTGYQVQLEESPAGQPLADSVACRGLTPARHDGHASAVVWVAPDRRLDAANIGRDRTESQGQIRLLDRPCLELGHQAGLRDVVLGDHQESARVAVQPVDNAGAHDTGDAAVRRIAGKQGVDERAARMAGSRVHNEARRLVDDEHVVVFVHDRERYRLRLHLEGDRIRDFHLDDLAGHDLLIRFDRQPADSDLAVRDELLNIAPG